MYDIPWSKPIRIEYPHRLPRVVDGPIAALDMPTSSRMTGGIAAAILPPSRRSR